MLLRRHRKRPLIFRHRPVFKSRFKKLLTIFIIILLILLIIFIIGTVRLGPVVLRMADSSITDIVTLTVNDVVSEKIADGSINYNELITLEKDSNGNVTALVTDMAKINQLQAEITNEVIDRLAYEETTIISIPLGNVTGSAVFAGMGPKIPVKISSVSSVLSSFSNDFSSAGINQTRHKIMLNVDVVLDILIPGYSTSSTVSTQVNVAETIIVGNVPSTYAELQRME
jgi:sporulation protein YunB